MISLAVIGYPKYTNADYAREVLLGDKCTSEALSTRKSHSGGRTRFCFSFSSSSLIFKLAVRGHEQKRSYSITFVGEWRSLGDDPSLQRHSHQSRKVVHCLVN